MIAAFAARTRPSAPGPSAHPGPPGGAEPEPGGAGGSAAGGGVPDMEVVMDIYEAQVGGGGEREREWWVVGLR